MSILTPILKGTMNMQQDSKKREKELVTWEADLKRREQVIML